MSVVMTKKKSVQLGLCSVSKHISVLVSILKYTFMDLVAYNIPWIWTVFPPQGLLREFISW